MIWLLLLVFLLLAVNGCVRRRMMIRSTPPGALVIVDNEQIGTTPVSADFTYYGTRTVTLVKDGYETLTVQHDFNPPWYQIPPLDFVSENLVRRELRDEHVVDLAMVPQRIVPTDELLKNAENLRSGAQQGYVVPPTSSVLPLPGMPGPPIESAPPPSATPERLPPPATPLSSIPHRGLWH